MIEDRPLPTSEPTAAFITHANYLHALDKVIATYVPGRHPLGPRIDAVVQALIPAVQRSHVFTVLRPQPPTFDPTPVERILANAWGTELLLNATGDIAADELIGFANNWSVIQVYYAAYHAVQAVLVARGEKRPEKHASTQRQFTAFWVDRRTDLPPWSVGWGNSGCINLPPGYPVRSVHNWENCFADNCLDFLVKGLRTTREDIVEQRLNDARKKKQAEKRKQWETDEARRLSKGKKPRKKPPFAPPRLSPTEKATIDSHVKSTSVLDYLYRLRVRSNYEDSTMFTEGPNDTTQSWSVYRELSRITCATMLVHELLVCKLIGAPKLQAIMERQLQAAKRPHKSGLSLRYDALRSSGAM